jgi:hypothetical protein
LSNAPTDKLNGYSCVDLQINSDRELSCFRAVDSSVLAQYADEYDARYNSRAKNYVREASKCPVGDGDAAEAPPSTFPAVFKAVARSSRKKGFGFTLIIGKQAVRNCLAYHGYAELDPALARSSSGALEVFDMFKLNQAARATPEAAKAINRSGASIVDSSEVVRQMETILSRRFGLPVTAKVRELELTYRGTQDIDWATRKSDLNTWQEGVGSVLKRHRYREVTRAEFNEMHLDPKRLGDMISGLLPFGDRQTARALIAPNVLFLVNDESDSCTQIAEVFVVEPVEDVQEDYGQIVTVLLGAGNCRHQRRPSGSLSDEVLENVTDYVSEGITGK